ncbi:hypothetical protein ACEPAG_2320 [Sanghuangporus baumii]
MILSAPATTAIVQAHAGSPGVALHACCSVTITATNIWSKTTRTRTSTRSAAGAVHSSAALQAGHTSCYRLSFAGRFEIIVTLVAILSVTVARRRAAYPVHSSKRRMRWGPS